MYAVAALWGSPDKESLKRTNIGIYADEGDR